MVGVVLRTLPVFLITVELGTVDGSHQYNLLGGVYLLDLINGNVDTSTIGVGIHAHISSFAVYQLLRLSVAVHHLLVLFNIPFANGYSVVIVVGANKNHNGIYRVAMLFS